MSQSLAQQAQAIADTYLHSLPADYASRYSAIADPDTISTLLQGFASGLNDRDCCAAAGISTRTLSRWYELAEQQPQSAHGLFVDALKRARAGGKLKRLQRIERAADDPKYWASNAWILERTDPEQFALRKDDASVPQIVVHAEGAREIKIGIIQPLSPPRTNDLACGNQGQVEMLSPINRDSVNYGDSVPAPQIVASAEPPAIAMPAVESAGGPQGEGAAAGGQDSPAALKGKSRPARKAKKGHGAA